MSGHSPQLPGLDRLRDELQRVAEEENTRTLGRRRWRPKAAVAGALCLLAGGAVIAISTATDEEQAAAPQEATAPTDLPVQRFSGQYVNFAGSLQQLASKPVASVRARATTSSYLPGEDPDLAYTLQKFETIESYWGDPGEAFTVFFTGGPAVCPDGPVLLGGSREPAVRGGSGVPVAASPPQQPRGRVRHDGARTGSLQDRGRRSYACA